MQQNSQDTALAQQLLARLIIDPTFREQVKRGQRSVETDFGSSKAVEAVAQRVSFDQLDRFNDIVRGTRFVVLTQRYAPLADRLGAAKLEEVVTEFLRTVMIPDGRGDMDLKLFDAFCREKFPRSMFANLIGLHTARYLSAQGGQSFMSADLTLGHRVVPLALDLPMERLDQQFADWSAPADGEPSYYVLMPHGDGIAVHEIDQESYDLLKSIERLTGLKDTLGLKTLLDDNRELLEQAAEEGIVRL
ncbi:MAG TPA: hypothetical protein VIL88_03525 [Devosia sp.]|jgi:hypothetical protein|uniref:hypothetical protein n=1 Tax=Devosia sp. TaxID=1871048 RepID=UPI002F934263